MKTSLIKQTIRLSIKYIIALLFISLYPIMLFFAILSWLMGNASFKYYWLVWNIPMRLISEDYDLRVYMECENE